MDIDVRVIGMDELLAVLDARKRCLEDMSQFWASVGEYLVKRTIRNFEREESPAGEKWVPWADRDAILKRRPKSKNRGKMKKGPPKILVSTGDLRRSVTSREKDKNAIFYALKDRLIFGSKLPYAATHQFGDSRNGRNIPARPYFGVTDKDREEIKRMMRDYFRRHRR